jgi:hypothetical protein
MDKHTSLQPSQTNSQLDIGLDPETLGPSNKNEILSHKETRQIVTPYAFFVADDLLGTPLAGPFRRGFGMLIDLFCIALLTQVSSFVLAAIAAWTFFKAGNRLKTKKRFNAGRIFLRMLVALLLFIVAVGIFEEINDNNTSGDNLPDPSANINDTSREVELLALTAIYLLDTKAMKQQVTLGECGPAFDCFQTLGQELVEDIVDIGLDRNIVDKALERYLKSVSEILSAPQLTELTNQLHQFVESKQIVKINDKPLSVMPDNHNVENNKPYTQSKGFINWLENVVEELGLGLGWAAFYFSVFTAWWKGQTPGKKLLGVKVIKLDNSPLNLWESFGRYGGYAAGLATGLMGFLQVFWDPNRQAIHDKISETLVIDLRKPKVPFIKKMAE